jgi:hypothetical protein
MADMVSDEISGFRHENGDIRSFEVNLSTCNKQLVLLSYTLKLSSPNQIFRICSQRFFPQHLQRLLFPLPSPILNIKPKTEFNIANQYNPKPASISH